MLRALQDRPDFLNLILIEILEFDSAHIRELLVTVLPQAQSMLACFFSNNPRLGDIPLLMLMRSFVGLFRSFYITVKLLAHPGTTPEFHQDAMHNFVNIYLYGVLKDEKPSHLSQTPEVNHS
jgi:hypothetical protein